MIKSIRISKENETFEKYVLPNNSGTFITGISKINFLVGPNNSGKSRFLRELFVSSCKHYNSESLYDKENDIEVDIINKNDFIKSIRDLIDRLNNSLKDIDTTVKFEEYHFLQILDKHEELIVRSEIEDIYNQLFVEFKGVLQQLINYPGYDEKFKEPIENFMEGLKKKSEDSLNLNNSYYIPVLRSLKQFGAFENQKEEYSPYPINDFSSVYFKFNYFKNSLLTEKTIHDYFYEKRSSSSGFEEPVFKSIVNTSRIFTGETLYNLIYKLRNSPEDEERPLKDFQSFLGESFFSNKKIILKSIEHEGIKNVHIKIGDEAEFPITKLGDGIQAIIILTFPIFIYSNEKVYFFIEEPENYLHPGMQRLFLETVSKIKNVQLFISTHSNHFLDLSIDIDNEISIFSFSKQLIDKKNRFAIENISSPNNNILDSLGVKNSSVFLANCTIWIEGISERIYIRKYLKLYTEEFPVETSYTEDLHFSFIEFSGNNITHWSFLDDISDVPNISATSISNRIFLISDLDKGKDERHSKLTESLGNNFYLLKVLEIENLLSPEIIKETLYEYQKGLEKLSFKDFEQEDYRNISMGEFIPSIILNGDLQKFISTKKEDKTPKIYNKLKFSKTASQKITKWSQMSLEAQELTKEIYKFIKLNNSNSLNNF